MIYNEESISCIEKDLFTVKSKIRDVKTQISMLTPGSKFNHMQGEVELIFRSGTSLGKRDLGSSIISWRTKNTIRNFLPFLKKEVEDDCGNIQIQYKHQGYDTKEEIVTEICENKKALADAVVSGLKEILDNLEKEQYNIEKTLERKVKQSLEKVIIDK